MITYTAFFDGASVPQKIRAREEDGWAVRQILESQIVSGVWVVFERSADDLVEKP